MSTQTFFLGGSTPLGFHTPFSESIADTTYFTYIIKGGPGTGKSSFMKRIASEFSDEEQEVYLCSSDPNSFDAVILKKHKIIFVDGTAPHVFDPEYPGAAQEILNMGEFWNAEALAKNKPHIISATSEYLQHHVRCRRFIAAAGSVEGDCVNIARSAIDRKKLEAYSSRLAKKLLTPLGGVGKAFFKQRSAITPLGIQTLIPKDDTIFCLDDKLMAGADYFLRSIAEKAISAGYTVEISINYLIEDGVYEILRLPEQNICFITANGLNGISAAEYDSKINFSRFYSHDAISAKKQRIKFSSSAAADLIDEAVNELSEAKVAHDKLEKYYINAVDFGGVNALAERISDKLHKSV